MIRHLSIFFTIIAVCIGGIGLAACSTTSQPANRSETPTAPAPLPDVGMMIARVAGQDGCKDFTASMQMISEDEKGKKDQVDFKVQRKYSPAGVSTFVSVVSPREDSDKAILAIEYPDRSTEAFSYLAGLDKLTKIGSDRQLGFRGAKVSIQELLGMELGQYDWKNVERVEKDNRKLIRVELIAKTDRILAYPRIIAFFNEADQQPAGFDLYDSKDELQKSAVVVEVKKIQNRQTITNVTINDLQQKLKLQLITREVAYDKGLSDRLFTQDNLKNFISGASRQLDRSR